MPTTKDMERSLANLLKESGDQRSVQAVVDEWVNAGKAQTTGVALTMLIREFQIESTTIPKITGTWFGVNQYEQREGGQHRTGIFHEDKRAMRTISAPPTDLQEFCRVSIGPIIRKKNKESQLEWLEYDPKTPAQIENGKRAEWDEVVQMAAPLSSVKGESHYIFTHGTTQGALPENAEEYDPKRPKYKKGDKIPKLPIYDPKTGKLAVQITVANGQDQAKIHLKDMADLDGLFGDDPRFERFLAWFKNPETSDEDRLKELRGRRDVYIFGRGGTQIRDKGTNLVKDVSRYISLGEVGWIRTDERLRQIYDGAKPAVVSDPFSAPAASAPAAAKVDVAGLLYADMATKETYGRDEFNALTKAQNLDPNALATALAELKSKAKIEAVAGEGPTRYRVIKAA